MMQTHQGTKRYRRPGNGCITCRIRKIKCDLAKPECNRCRSTGRQCDGYERQELSLPEIPAFRYGPSWSLHERQAFEFFLSHTSIDLSGVFSTTRETNVWSRLLLQGAHDNPGIKHAICAFGAAHQHLLGKENKRQSQTYYLAAEQYNKAVRHTLRTACSDQMSVNAVLTMCVLFTLLERLLGDVKTAITHLRAGLKLLDDMTLCPSSSVQSMQASAPATYLPTATITSLLRRLQRQLLQLGQPHLESNFTPNLSFEADVPTVFANLEEASNVLELYLNYAYRPMSKPEWRPEGLYQIPKPVEADTAALLSQMLTKWTNAFELFLQSAKLESTPIHKEEQKMIHALHVWRILLGIILAPNQDQDDMVFDKFTPEFATVVVHCAAVIRAQQRTSELDCSLKRMQQQRRASLSTSRSGSNKLQTPAEKPVLSPMELDTSIKPAPPSSSPPVSVKRSPPGSCHQYHVDRTGKLILTLSPFPLAPALYIVASRCRDPVIRRQALQLLREIEWRDGFWASKIASEIAERRVQIEENGYLAGRAHRESTPTVERAEQISVNARCGQVRVLFGESNTLLVDFFNANESRWVPGPDYWKETSPDSLHEVGRIREKWVITS